MIVRFVLLYITIASGLEPEKWKVCKNFDFCQKIRDKMYQDNFEIIAEHTQLLDENTVEGVIKKIDRESYKFRVEGYANSNFRFTIVNDNVTQHPVNVVFEDQPKKSKIKYTLSDVIEIYNEQSRLTIHLKPFKIILSKNNVTFLQINSANFLVLSSDENKDAIALDFIFTRAKRAYGIPEHADHLSLKDTVQQGLDPYRLFNLDNYGYETESRESLYGVVPVIYGHGPTYTSGVFWLNTGQTFVDIAQNTDGVQVNFISETGWIDFITLSGPTLEDTTKQFASLTGKAPLPPLFSLGYHQSRYSYKDQKDVEEVVANFEENKIPMDVIWLDIDYTDDKKYFTWNYKLFPKPVEMQNKLDKLGKKVVAVIDPHIKVEKGYVIYDEGLKNDYFVKNANGTNYEGDCWPGRSTWIDFLNKEAADWYQSKFQLDKFKNSTLNLHIWNDMNEPTVFGAVENTIENEALHDKGKYTHKQVHNIYGFYQTKATYQGLLERSNHTLRPFILTRSHFAGSQRYAAIWTGDNIATWDHLTISIPTCLTQALAGISFCGADVGGFVNSVEDELLQRWYQVGAWLPFFREHSANDTKRREPYLYPKGIRDRIRNAINERYFHMPYWYTLFWEHHINGLPIIRPLSFYYFEDLKTYDIDTEWLVGENILVAPVLQKNSKNITVYLPGNKETIWYHGKTQDKNLGGGELSLKVDLDSMPYFYRGGSIIPKRRIEKTSTKWTRQDLFNLEVYIDNNNEAFGTLYIDDYETFEYKINNYLYMKYSFKNNCIQSEILSGKLCCEVNIGEIILYGLKQKFTIHFENTVHIPNEFEISDSQNNILMFRNLNSSNNCLFKICLP